MSDDVPRAEQVLPPAPPRTVPSEQDPTITDVDGRIAVTWPHGRGPVVVHPEVIDGWADSVNRERAEVERLRGLLADVLDELARCYATAPRPLEDVERWRREAGLT